MLLVTNSSYYCDQSVVVLGMFDGVHIGHRVLIQKGKVLANRHHVPLIVCTFSNHPLDVIAPEKAPKQLTTLPERSYEMEKLGVDVLVAQDFTKETMNIAPEDYIGYLVQRFHPIEVVCGYNHSFGKNGVGTPMLLQAVGAGLGFRTWIVPQITLNGWEVSSTEIRKQLTQGNLTLANQLLGRLYSISGILKESGLLIQEKQKQMLPEGKYRCFIEKEKSLLPCTAKILGEHILIASSTLETMITLKFLSKTE